MRDNLMRIVLVVLLVLLIFLLPSSLSAQRFSKDFFTLRLFGEHITVMASIDRTTKQHVAREFLLGNGLSFVGMKPRTNRIVLYSFMIGFELGQRNFDLLDLLAGAIGIELNLWVRRFI